jgi:hypothetical protein
MKAHRQSRFTRRADANQPKREQNDEGRSFHEGSVQNRKPICNQRRRWRIPSAMLLRIFIVAALCLIAWPASALEEPETEERKPGVVGRFFNIFRGSKTDSANWKRLHLTMSVEPVPLKPSETRQVKVTLRLISKSKRLIQLEFPTTQRIEVLVRNRAGKLVEQWSEDQAFANEPTLVTINPGERLEYSANIATRDMEPGQPYTIIGYFPNFEQLRVSRTIVPEK